MVQRRSNLIQSLDRGLRLVELVGQADEPVSLAELARELQVDRSTAYRLLNTLVKRGYLIQDPVTKRYDLGLKFVVLGRRAIDGLNLHRLARPFLRALTRETSEGANLVALAGTQALCIEQEPSLADLAVTYEVGSSFVLHATAPGKILLASLSPEKQREILESAPLAVYTPRTTTDPAKLARELSLVCERGFAVDDEERYPGVRYVACPVYDYRQQVVAAISLGGPSARVTLDRLSVLVRAVSRTAVQISAALGCPACFVVSSVQPRCAAEEPAAPAEEASPPRFLAAF